MRHPLIWFGFSMGLCGAIVLGWLSLGENADYYVTPGMLTDEFYNSEKTIRIGGLVAAKSLREEVAGWSFDMEDGVAKTPVRFQGSLPALFKEGQGAIAEGQFSSHGVFEASRILARHDQYYQPPSPKEYP